jgi:hypothetical protein
MSRTVWFVVLLLLGAGVVPADDARESEDTAPAAEEQFRDDASESEPVASVPEEQDGAPDDEREVRASEEKQDGEAEKPKNTGPKLISGMSVLGNQEAPKSLVIVPWKSSELGDSLGISTMLDDSRQPVDKEVFLRALAYYEIRSETKRP